MAEAGVDYALVLTSYLVNANRPSVAQVVKAVERVPNLGVVAGISYLHYKERDLRELADFLRAGLVQGLKLYPGYEPFYPHDSRLEVVYQLAEEFDVPVMIHSGDTYHPRGKLKYAHPLEVDEVAVDHPKVKFVICHLGQSVAHRLHGGRLQEQERLRRHLGPGARRVHGGVRGLHGGADRRRHPLRRRARPVPVRLRLAHLLDEVLRGVRAAAEAPRRGPARDLLRERAPAVPAAPAARRRRDGAAGA